MLGLLPISLLLYVIVKGKMKATSMFSFITILLPLLFVDLVAQEVTVIVPGDRIRFRAPEFNNNLLVGTVIALNPTTLELKLKWRTTPVEVPRASLSSLEVRRGTKSMLVQGAFVGAFVGVLAVALTAEPDQEPGCAFCAQAAWDFGPSKETQMVIVGILGAGVGMTIGKLIRVDKWQKVPLEQMRVAVVPYGPSGYKLSASLSFAF